MKRIKRSAVATATVAVLVSGLAQAEGVLSGEEIVNKCYYKYAGKDQRSHMSITVQAPGGKPATSTYTRLWKDYDGEDELVDKVVLFTETPPHNKDLAFMRWGYSAVSDKNPDMWIYLPDMQKVRRLSQRNPTDQEWVIRDEDLRLREPIEDEHRYLGTEAVDGHEYHLVEFTPKKEDPAYSKRVSWFSKSDNWDECVERRVDYYNKDGEMVKQRMVEWKQIGDAWTWDKVSIISTINDASIIYDMDKVEVNVGLDDNIFTQATMRRGYRP